MNVLITGGAGFLGQRLCAKLLERGWLRDRGGGQAPIEHIVLADQASPPLPPDPRVSARAGDIRDADFLDALVGPETGAVFHLAAVVSAGAEEDFDLGMSVNVHATLGLLERCRAAGTRPRLVFASSVAAYGGEMPAVIGDLTILTPQSSYGTQKAVVELLLADYSRKGFVDGRTVRLPTIVVRPGRPNRAASSFASGIIREPLSGEAADCPVGEDTPLWILSPRRAVQGLVHAFNLPESDWEGNRSVALPGLTVRVGEMLRALEAVAGPKVRARVQMRPNPFIAGIVAGWPAAFEPARGRRLGFEADDGVTAIIEAFVDDELGGRIAR